MRKRRFSCFIDPGREASRTFSDLHRRRFPPQRRYRELFYRIGEQPQALLEDVLRQRQRGLRSSATAFSTCPHSEQVCAVAVVDGTRANGVPRHAHLYAS